MIPIMANSATDFLIQPRKSWVSWFFVQYQEAADSAARIVGDEMDASIIRTGVKNAPH